MKLWIKILSRAALTVAVLLSVGALSNQAQAQTTGSFTATLTINSSLTWTENTALSFGTIVLVDDGTNAPTATLGADGTYTDTSGGSSAITQLGTAAAGDFTVGTGLSAASNLLVTFPASATLALSGSSSFTVSTFVIGTLGTGSYDTGVTADQAACLTAISGGGSCGFTTDGSGDVTFPIGATLTAVQGGSYADGNYSGSFDLIAAYN